MLSKEELEMLEDYEHFKKKGYEKEFKWGMFCFTFFL